MSKHDSVHIYCKVFDILDKHITKYQQKIESNTKRRYVALAHIVDCKDIIYASGYYLDDLLTIDRQLEEQKIQEYRTSAANTWHRKVINTDYKFIHTEDGRADLLKTYLVSYAYHTQIIEYCALAIATYRNHHFNRQMVYFFIKHINAGLSKHVIDGGVLKFSPKIGTIQLMQNDHTKPQKEVVRWDKSMELKRQLESNGIPLYSTENPDGIKWIIRECSDLKVWWVWKRANNIYNRNTKRFLFRPTRFNNTGINVEQWTTAECSDNDILDNTQLSNLYKIIILHKRNPLWFLRFPILIYKSYVTRSDRLSRV